MRRPNILLVTSYFPPIAGGSAVVYHNMCRHLADRVTVLTTWRHYIGGEEHDGWRQLDLQQPFRIDRMELLRPLMVDKGRRGLVRSLWEVVSEDLWLRQKVLRRVLRIIRRDRVGVVCFGELYSLSWLAPILRRLGVPCMFYIHGEEVTASSASRFYGRGALARLRKAPRVIAVSEFTRRELVARGVPEDRVRVITNGVDLEKFSMPGDPAEVRRRHGLEGKSVLLTVGRVERRKGHDRVIPALAKLRQEFPDVAYLIVGKGGDVPRLRALAAEHRVDDCVVFAGLVADADLASYYQACDVFVMPNRTLEDGDTEGFGLVFLEANACRKPVIGGDAGGVPEAIVDGETGLLVDGSSPEPFAEAARRLLGDPALRDRLGEQGWTRAQGLGWASKAEEFRGVCEDLLR